MSLRIFKCLLPHMYSNEVGQAGCAERSAARPGGVKQGVCRSKAQIAEVLNL